MPTQKINFQQNLPEVKFRITMHNTYLKQKTKLPLKWFVSSAYLLPKGISRYRVLYVFSDAFPNTILDRNIYFSWSSRRAKLFATNHKLRLANLPTPPGLYLRSGFLCLHFSRVDGPRVSACHGLKSGHTRAATVLILGWTAFSSRSCQQIERTAFFTDDVIWTVDGSANGRI